MNSVKLNLTNNDRKVNWTGTHGPPGPAGSQGINGIQGLLGVTGVIDPQGPNQINSTSIYTQNGNISSTLTDAEALYITRCNPGDTVWVEVKPLVMLEIQF